MDILLHRFTLICFLIMGILTILKLIAEQFVKHDKIEEKGV